MEGSVISKILTAINPKKLSVLISFCLQTLTRYRYLKVHQLKSSLNAVYFHSAINQVIFKNAYPVQVDELCIICPRGIGDTLIVAGLAGKIKKQHNVNKLQLLVKPEHEFIASVFPSVDKIGLLQNGIEYLNADNTFIIADQKLAPNNYFFGHFERFSMANIIGFNGINMFDCYKALFKLDMQSVLEQPKEPNADAEEYCKRIFIKNSLSPLKTVLIATGANSVNSFNALFWVSVCKILKTKGYDIILNSDDLAHELSAYANHINIPLNHLPAFALMACNVIALRSGLCDLLAIYKVNMVVLYPKIKWFNGSLLEGASLINMGFSNAVSEFEVDAAENHSLELFSYLYSWPQVG